MNINNKNVNFKFTYINKPIMAKDVIVKTKNAFLIDIFFATDYTDFHGLFNLHNLFNFGIILLF